MDFFGSTHSVCPEFFQQALLGFWTYKFPMMVVQKDKYIA